MNFTDKDLFEIALRYIIKGYNREDLKYGDDLYDAINEEKLICLSYYDKIIELGTDWAQKTLENFYND